MPPFAGAAGLAATTPAAAIVTLNVGGRIFQTTPQTLAAAGPSSLLSSLPPFIDRDPDLFAAILALLRTGRLPSSSFSGEASVDISDLFAEAEFYGLDPRLLLPSFSSSSFSPLSLRRSLLLPLPGRDPVSVLSAAPSGELIAAHGSKITSFDFTLRNRRTTLTSLPAVDSVLSLPYSHLAAAGAADFPGLQLLDLSSRSLRKTLHWRPHPSAPGATVQAIAAAADRQILFSSYETGRRNASAILAFDLAPNGEFRPVSEIARREIYGAELDSAIPATKLRWVPYLNILMAAGSHWGPSGVLGEIRLWDIRSGGDPAWELKEKTDCFADVTVSDELSAVFKVGVNSGDVFMADLRKLNAAEPWVGLGGWRWNGENLGNKEGKGCKIECEGRHVFCSRGGEVELWSEVTMAAAAAAEEKVMRRNVMGRAKDVGGARILQMVFGGKRMAVARSEVSGVEVWESSDRG
ncbi:BTB/POZ domain-containing protein [Apostasia shenzhenica]|uniref:BTB/POZ domain-containing protein n=1 Tax=Apostasia shenzhenica TaxID=1088818 RepID=A0A2H9ZRD3_9ASPA|nr:BTB/POZ domain-containing protein [Apostasia shenzhenica]